MITKNHLRSVISLARQSKEDLRMISDDGGEVFAHKIVVSMFSTSMANLFLNQDEVMTTVMVPASCKTLQNIIKIIWGIIDIDEEDLKAAREASRILFRFLDLLTVVTHDEYSRDCGWPRRL